MNTYRFVVKLWATYPVWCVMFVEERTKRKGQKRITWKKWIRHLKNWNSWTMAKKWRKTPCRGRKRKREMLSMSMLNLMLLLLLWITTSEERTRKECFRKKFPHYYLFANSDVFFAGLSLIRIVWLLKRIPKHK